MILRFPSRTLRMVAVLLWVGLFPLNAHPQSAQPAGTRPFQVIASAFPPYSYEGDNRAEGLTVKTVRALFAHIGLAPTIEVYPWARAYKTVREVPGTLLFSVARTPTREDLFIWVAPVMDYDVWLYRRAGRTEITPDDLEDLSAYTYAGMDGDVKTNYLESAGAFVEHVRSEDHAIKMLAAGRIDMVASDKNAMAHRIAQLGYRSEDFVAVRQLGALAKTLYLVAHPDTDPDLVDRLRRATRLLKDDD